MKYDLAYSYAIAELISSEHRETEADHAIVARMRDNSDSAPDPVPAPAPTPPSSGRPKSKPRPPEEIRC